MHGLVTLDADERPLRPAILWNDQRTAAECAEIEERVGLDAADRADRQPRAHRLHRAEAALAAHARAGGVRAHRAHPAAEGLRAAAARGRARDRRRRRVGNAALRRREPPLERRGARRARAFRASGCRPSYESTEIAGAGDQAAGALGVGIDEPGPLSVVLGTSGVVFGVLPGVQRRRRGAPAHVLPRRARDVARDGRDALGRRLAALAARRRSAATTRSSSADAERWAAGRRRAALPAVPDRRAHAARRPGRARRVRRA